MTRTERSNHTRHRMAGRQAPPVAAMVACAKLLIVVIMLGLVGCCGGGDEATIDIPEDDPELHVSRQNARASVSQFIYALENPRAGQTLFAVKAKFVDGEAVEYMWLTDLRYENGQFIGVVNNAPSVVSNIRMGQEHSVGVYEIDDWMILENDQIVGGYSVEVVARRQSLDASETKMR